MHIRLIHPHNKISNRNKQLRSCNPKRKLVMFLHRRYIFLRERHQSNYSYQIVSYLYMVGERRNVLRNGAISFLNKRKSHRICIAFVTYSYELILIDLLGLHQISYYFAKGDSLQNKFAYKKGKSENNMVSVGTYL